MGRMYEYTHADDKKTGTNKTKNEFTNPFPWNESLFKLHINFAPIKKRRNTSSHGKCFELKHENFRNYFCCCVFVVFW